MGSGGDDSPVFSLDVTADGDGRTTVSLAGEVDLATAHELAGAVCTALAGGPVVLDLRDVTFMDSAGIQALNTALREAAEKHQELRVCAEMQPCVVQVLKLTGMMGLLQVEDGP